MDFPTDKYEIVYADPPWHYYGDKFKMGAAGKEYELLSPEEISKFPVRSIMEKNSVLFLWATCPKLHDAISVISSWGLNYRGVAYVWVKTNKQGNIIHGQGVRPTLVKPTTELLLCATPQKVGRPLPLLTEAQGQVVLSNRGKHSQKPEVFRNNIVDLLGERKRIELFAREEHEGWDNWGDESPKKNI